MLVDSHAHVTSGFYDDIKTVIHNATANNVLKIINCSTGFKDMEEVIKISNDFGFYYAIGIHPEEMSDIGDYKYKLEEIIKNNINDNKFVAIGEIGLDYHFNSDNKEEQKSLLDFQLSLAEKYNKSIIMHSRDATLDTIEMLKKHKLKGVIHCFSGSLETAREYIKMGYKIGIGGILTFKNCNLKNYIKDIGIKNIILETDSPFMTPEPYRGQKNEPKNVLEVAKFLSIIFDKSIEEIEEVTTNNVNEVFDIEKS